jgi:hypothetical protein
MTFVLFLLSMCPAWAQYPYRGGDIIIIPDKEVEERKAAAYEERNREMKRSNEAREEHWAESRKAAAYDSAKRERRAKVKRLRGKQSSVKK